MAFDAVVNLICQPSPSENRFRAWIRPSGHLQAFQNLMVMKFFTALRTSANCLDLETCNGVQFARITALNLPLLELVKRMPMHWPIRRLHSACFQ
jgi:hypothetical protein